MHRPGDVLDLLLAEVLEGNVELVAHLVAYDAADADAARRGEAFESRRDIDAVAVDVVLVADDVAQIDPDPKLDAFRGRHFRVPLGHGLLRLHRAAHRLDDARKLDQHTVPRGLDDAAAMLGDFRPRQVAP